MGAPIGKHRRGGLSAECAQQAEPGQIYSGVFVAMLRGYRSIGIAALVAAILLSFGLGAYSIRLGQPESPNRYPGYQSSDSKEQGALTPVANVPVAVMQRRPCHNPESVTESDLCAQWRAAQAAEKSADWTLYGVIASAVGIALFIWQLALTREAVKDTGDATKAMRESNEILRSVEDARLVVSITNTNYDPKERVFFHTVQFKNIGRSAAIIHILGIGVDIHHVEEELIAGATVTYDDVCITLFEHDLPCDVCHNGEVPENEVLMFEQTTPLRGRFRVEVPCRFWFVENAWKAEAFFAERRESKV